jgi:hypothetical protein
VHAGSRLAAGAVRGTLGGGLQTDLIAGTGVSISPDGTGTAGTNTIAITNGIKLFFFGYGTGQPTQITVVESPPSRPPPTK